MTDLEHVHAISSRVRELNAELELAAQAGLQVSLSIVPAGFTIGKTRFEGIQYSAMRMIGIGGLGAGRGMTGHVQNLEDI
jgi:hypothetical protein